VVQRFGAYEILYELRTGGMGAVLLGRRRGPGAFEQLVAIKTIRPEHAHTAAVRAMFLDEAAILARLNHPAVATVHDFGEQGGTLYMVMEYVAGIAFRDAMEHGLPPAIAARAITEACRGVHAAHELRDLHGQLLGVVHRDISPDNLMFGFDGHVKVIDFGIALIKNRQAPVTELGMVKGKPPYMSPEQVKNDAMDRRSDVFSLAVVLWEMLTARPLFEGDSIYAIAMAVEHQALVPPSQVLGAPLPLGLDAVVMNALDRDLAHRTRSAAELAEQLEQVIQTAGDETLEAWAERALAGPREAHRSWLAGVVAGHEAPRLIGRPTGSVTALSPQAGRGPPPPVVPAAAPALPGEPLPGAGPATHLAPMSDHEIRALPPRRSLVLPILLGLAVLLAVGGALVLTRRPVASMARDASAVADAAAPDAASDAAIEARADATEATPLVPVDVPADAASRAPFDAPLPPHDAGHRRPPPPLRPPRDAGRPPPHDTPGTQGPETAAGSVPAGQGSGQGSGQGRGRITALHQGSRYLNIVIDGDNIGPTPQYNLAVPAGTHTVQLLDPPTGKVVVKRTVKVDAGQTVTVTEP
jgi:serine/threonine-protein kinase